MAGVGDEDCVGGAGLGGIKKGGQKVAQLCQALTGYGGEGKGVDALGDG